MSRFGQQARIFCPNLFSEAHHIRSWNDKVCRLVLLLHHPVKTIKTYKTNKANTKKSHFGNTELKLKTLKKSRCYLLSTTFILKHLNEIGDRAIRNYVGLQQEWWPRVQRCNFLTKGWNAESLSAAEPPCKVSNGPRIYNYWKPHQVVDRFTKQSTEIYWNGRKFTFRLCTHLGLSYFTTAFPPAMLPQWKTQHG